MKKGTLMIGKRSVCVSVLMIEIICWIPVNGQIQVQPPNDSSSLLHKHHLTNGVDWLIKVMK